MTTMSTTGTVTAAASAEDGYQAAIAVTLDVTLDPATRLVTDVAAGSITVQTTAPGGGTTSNLVIDTLDQARALASALVQAIDQAAAALYVAPEPAAAPTPTPDDAQTPGADVGPPPTDTTATVLPDGSKAYPTAVPVQPAAAL